MPVTNRRDVLCVCGTEEESLKEGIATILNKKSSLAVLSSLGSQLELQWEESKAGTMLWLSFLFYFSHTVCFDYIISPPPTPPRSSLPSYPPNFVFFSHFQK